MLWKNTVVLGFLAAVYLPSVSAGTMRGVDNESKESLKKRRLARPPHAGPPAADTVVNTPELINADADAELDAEIKIPNQLQGSDKVTGPNPNKETGKPNGDTEVDSLTILEDFTNGVPEGEENRGDLGPAASFLKHGCAKIEGKGPNEHKVEICHGNVNHWNVIEVDLSSNHEWEKTDQNNQERGNGPNRELGIQLPDLCPGDTFNGKKLVKNKNRCEFEGEGSTSGDPHFSTWQGQKFDFHGGCDLVLVDNPMFNNGQGLTIHIRTKIVRWWSYVESAVVKIGSDTLEVKAGAERAFWLNGEQGDSALTYRSGPMPFTIGGFRVRFRIPDDNKFQFKIFLDDDATIVLKSVKEFLRVDVLAGNEELFGSSVGMMGEFSTGNMVARDGKTVIEDPVEFGKEWQVLESEPKLFHILEGVQHPTTCAMPTTLDKMVENVSRRLAGASVSREMAEDACAHAPSAEFDDCVSDVLATDDIDLAGAY